MKNILIILLLTAYSQVVLCQEFESIVIRVEHADEPPTKHGPQVFEIAFTTDEQNNFVANTNTTKYRRKKRVKLQRPQIISAEKIQKFVDWKKMSKTDFLLSELGTEIDELINANSTYKPDFQIRESTVEIDSFNTCKDWQFKRRYSTGGYSISINANQGLKC